jgi:hypothetical protein
VASGEPDWGRRGPSHVNAPEFMGSDHQAEREYAELHYEYTMREQSFDPLRSRRFHWQMLRRWAMFETLAAAIGFVVSLFLLLVALASRNAGSLAAATVILPILLVGAFVLYVLLPVPGLLGQWGRLYSLRAPAGDIAFACITQAMERHAVPHDSLAPRKRWPPGEGSRNYLELRRGVFAGYISVFPHGLDLYVGWSFWIYMSPLRLLFLAIGRWIQKWTARGNEMYQTLRYESTRATLAAIHACILEGVDGATRAADRAADLAGAAGGPAMTTAGPVMSTARPVAGTAGPAPAGA